MKILTVVYSLEKGGTQRAAQNFAEGYFENGHDSRLVVTQTDGFRRAELNLLGIPVYRFLSDENIKLVENWEPDIVHIHSHELTFEDVATVLACSRSAFVVETNVFSKPSPWAHLVDTSFQLSEWCQWLYEKRSKKRLPSDIIPYPVNIDAFKKASGSAVSIFRENHGILPKEFLIGRVGQAYDGKWSPLLIKSFIKIRKDSPHIRLLLVNPPNSVRMQREQYKHKESIIIIDSIEGDEDLSVAYSAIDLFVLIADQGESFGMVLSESMLCETPIITLSTPWGDNSQCEVVGHMNGGLIVTTPKGLIAAIRILLKDEQLRMKLGRQGRKRMIEKYGSLTVTALAINRCRGSGAVKIRPNVVEIYKDSLDDPAFIVKVLLHFGIGLEFIRYIVGYEPWTLFPSRFAKRIIAHSKKILL